mmetsp:Transcript_115214/g.273877  ORF Transcript_115214/g.273877 Transcript_115214/m.273877 type:complete len:84 (+) Transcript_115214:522-773(+)
MFAETQTGTKAACAEADNARQTSTSSNQLLQRLLQPAAALSGVPAAVQARGACCAPETLRPRTKCTSSSSTNSKVPSQQPKHN